MVLVHVILILNVIEWVIQAFGESRPDNCMFKAQKPSLSFAHFPKEQSFFLSVCLSTIKHTRGLWTQCDDQSENAWYQLSIFFFCVEPKESIACKLKLLKSMTWPIAGPKMWPSLQSVYKRVVRDEKIACLGPIPLTQYQPTQICRKVSLPIRCDSAGEHNQTGGWVRRIARFPV